MHQFRPKRPTFLEVKELGERVWNHKVVLPLYDSQGDVIAKTVHEGPLELDLNQSYPVDLYRLVSFDRQLPGWKPDRLLTIAPLSEHIQIDQKTEFWQGSAHEVTKHHEKLAKAAATATRRDARRQSGQPPRQKKPKTSSTASKSQATAAREARNNDPEHQAVMALCDVDPELEAASLLGEDFWEGALSSISGGSVSDCDVAPDAELDVRLLSLLEKEKHDGAPIDLSEGSECLDDFFGDSDPEDTPIPTQPKLKVRFQTAPKSKSDEEPSYEPTSPAGVASRSKSSSSSSTSSDSSKSSASGDDEQGGASKIGGPRGKCDLDKSDEAPAGCKLKRYVPGDHRPPFWQGTLPPGVRDAKGKHTRRRSFRVGQRTEADALAQIELWLTVVLEELAAGDTPDEHSDKEDND